MKTPTLTTDGLKEALQGLQDPRRAQGRMHTIDIVVLTAIMGIMSGCRGYRAMEDFVAREREDLIRHLKPKKERVPSASTIRRVMTDLDSKSFLSLFGQWVSGFHACLKEELVAIDGKALKGTASREGQMAHLVSLFSHRYKESLSMAKTVAKSNEIPLVREMVEQMEQEVRFKGKEKQRFERAFFISSLNQGAAYFQQAIRGHWSIENSLRLRQRCHLWRRCLKNQEWLCT